MPSPAKRPFVYAEAGTCRRSRLRKNNPVVWQVTHGQGAPYFDEEIKFIGIFSSRKNARAAVAYLKARPGFRKAGGRFFVEPCSIDKVEWNTGYITWNGSKGKFDPR